MNERIKGYVGVAGIIALLGFAFSAVSYVRSYSKSIEPSSFRSFSVSGEGKVVAIPDVAEFSFSVVTQGGKDIARLQADNTEKTNKAIAYVKAQGVEEKDIKTEGYNVEPRYQYYDCDGGVIRTGSFPCPPPEIVGYTISQSVTVKVRDFKKVGDIFSGVVREGANSVSGLGFRVDEPEKARSEARTKAIEQARAKAKEIAKAGGFSVGRLLSLDEGGGFSPSFYERGGYGGEIALDKISAAPAPSIEPGSQDVVVTVELRYEIE